MKTSLEEEWACLFGGFVKIKKVLVERPIYTKIGLKVLFSWPEEPEVIHGSVFLQTDC